MFVVSLILFCCFTLLFCIHVFWMWKFTRLFETTPNDSPPAELPRVLVVLSLRGADPFLKDCLNGLFRQNYPDYQVRIVIDSRTDPAWRVVEEAIRDNSARNVELKPLEKRLSTCGLRVSALIQELGNLQDDLSVVAYLDADSIPYPNWLRDLVAPLADPGVGATTGIRYYVPQHLNLGSQVRVLWNAGAVMQMAMYGIAWGGSMAFQARLFRDPYLLDKWSRLLWEDTFTQRAMDDLGLKLRFVPGATLMNRERTDLRSCLRYITRQMLNVRLYHDLWYRIIAYALFTTLMPLTAVVLMAAAFAEHQTATAMFTGAGLAVHLLGVAAMIVAVNLNVRRVVAARGEPTWEKTFRPTLLLAGLLTPFAYLACVLTAAVTRRIEWRGITYTIAGRCIKMLEYRPLVQKSDDLSPSRSRIRENSVCLRKLNAFRSWP